MSLLLFLKRYLQTGILLRIFYRKQIKQYSMSLSDCNETRTHNQLVRLNGWVFVYDLSGCGFEPRCSHLNFRFRACFEQGVLWYSGNYRVWMHSETRTWHDKNIQSFSEFCTECIPREMLFYKQDNVPIKEEKLLSFCFRVLKTKNLIFFLTDPPCFFLVQGFFSSTKN